MKMFPITLAIVALGAASTFARIGENEQQIEARYGKPSSADDKNGALLLKAFHCAGMIIGVTFINGISELEIFSKEDKSEFSENEIRLLLEANSDGGSWTKVPNFHFGLQHWLIQDSGRFAQYTELKKTFAIGTNKFTETADAQRAKNEKEKLKGF